MSRIVAVDLGLLPYAEALELQRTAARARIRGALSDDVLFLVEHPPVVTLGRAAQSAGVQVPREILAARGVDVFDVERGGDVTFHGPGQLVGYPIFNLKQHKQDLHWYLRQIEEALILSLAEYRVAGFRQAGYTGVWVDAEHPRKIASIGVHARDWVTWHGFALNVRTDLSFFDLIVPCGIQNVRMTSLARETGREDLTLVETIPEVVDAFGRAFDRPVEYLPDQGVRLLEALREFEGV
ncbi:MAG: lipoyl(octanoyl) transferase LipB [Gemmatimonadota bacterium]